MDSVSPLQEFVHDSTLEYEAPPMWPHHAYGEFLRALEERTGWIWLYTFPLGRSIHFIISAVHSLYVRDHCRHKYTHVNESGCLLQLEKANFKFSFSLRNELCLFFFLLQLVQEGEKQAKNLDGFFWPPIYWWNDIKFLVLLEHRA